MAKRKITFVMICCNEDTLFGLDRDGDVWFKNKGDKNWKQIIMYGEDA